MLIGCSPQGWIKTVLNFVVTGVRDLLRAIALDPHVFSYFTGKLNDKGDLWRACNSLKMTPWSVALQALFGDAYVMPT
ncbi:MAG: hypothetical protein ABI905_09455 [Betaproteobacteria bacterium]